MSVRASSLKKPFYRLAIVQTLLVILVLGVFGAVFHSIYYHQTYGEVERTGRAILNTLRLQLPAELEGNWCRYSSPSAYPRISIIDATRGRLLCDTIFPPDNYPELLQREEILKARQSGGFATSQRLSHSSEMDVLYEALYIPERKVFLRVSLPTSQFKQALEIFDQYLIIVICVLALVLILTIQWVSGVLFLPFVNRVLGRARQQIYADFVGNVTHELKTPITSIRGFADTLLADVDKGRGAEKEFIQIIASESNRLLTMINELLELSALDSGALVLRLQNVQTQEITDDVLRQLNSVYGAKKFKIETQYSCTEAFADPEKLQQILLNIIGNSMKYSPEQSTIKVSWIKGSKGESVLLVSDEGPGLSQAEQKKVFERFYRTRAGRETGQSGSGLGLSIVKELVELHHGRVSVNSVLGKGSEFRVNFPQEGSA